MKSKVFLSFLIMIAGVFALGYFTTWWAPAIWVLFIAALMKLSIKEGLLNGGLSTGIVWGWMARWTSQYDPADIITKTGELMGGLSHQVMILITLLIGFITGFLSGWVGSVVGQYIRKQGG